MRRWWAIAAMTLASGCQLPAARVTTAADGDAVTRLDAALAGEYDNDEQVRAAHTGVRAGTQIAVPHLRERWRLLDQSHGRSLWLWQLQDLDPPPNASVAFWIYRIEGNGARVLLTPYRAIDPAKAAAELNDASKAYKFAAAEWAELAPCTQTGAWKGGQFAASADASSCSALLPGLGAAASLLPLRLTLDGDLLHTVTFADQARGADAGVDAHRLRWFSGWVAINGGGPKAQPGNQDWHVHEDLRLSSAGELVPIRWRDGAASGYSLELQRTTYTERKLSVLQLNVVEDASGHVMDYAWSSPQATGIGLNLGWLQVGATEAAAK